MISLPSKKKFNFLLREIFKGNFNFRCLEKNPDHRPFLAELMEHPFFTELPANDYHVNS